IATRHDWGLFNSAVAISGSPYHMRLLNLDPPNRGGNQDRSLSADAVIFPASVTIVKDALPNDLANFSFTTNIVTATFAGPGFSLDDDSGVVGGDNTLS